MSQTALLIDSQVPDQIIITNSLLNNVSILPVSVKPTDILAISGLTRLGLMFHNLNNCIVPFFSDPKSVRVRQNVNHGGIPSPTTNFQYYSQTLIQLLSDLVQQNGNFTLDLISCDMNTQSFVNETAIVSAITNANIEYSVNQTGNGVDADWILESNSENLLNIYFTNTILSWIHTLYYYANNIILNTYPLINTFINQVGALTYSKGEYKLHQDLTLNLRQTGYPVHFMLNETEVFNGNNHTITLITSDSSGLFVFNSSSLKTTVKNLTITRGDDNAYIATTGGGLVKNNQANFTVKHCKYIGIESDGDHYSGGLIGSYCSNFVVENSCVQCDLDIYSGGICGSNCSNFLIKHCKNNMNQLLSNNIYEYAGGICGAYCFNFKIEHCTNNVNDNDSYDGGIVGSYCKNFEVSDCENNGILDEDSGGIIAPACYNFVVKNCINTKPIGEYGGGIVGYNSQRFEVELCKNIGNINNSHSGGIVGGYCGNFKINKCKNYGDITVDASESGGIVGAYAGSSFFESSPDADSYMKIYNCTNYGKLLGTDSAGIVGSYFANNDISQINQINIKARIYNCLNKGDVLGTNNAGIVASYLGYVGYTNGSYVTVEINKCKTNTGNVIGQGIMENAIFQPSVGIFVPNKLIIKRTYSGEKVPLIISFATQILNDTDKAIYVKRNDTIVNLLTHPTYISYAK